MAINDLDGFVIDEEELDEEEFVEIPNTGIDGYIRPILISSDNDPEEIINLNAGNLRVDENAYVIGSVGIGTTIPTSDLEVVGDVKISGIVTANTFYGNLVGIASTAIYATSAGIATYATSAGIATYASTAGISTYAETAGIATTSQGLTGTPNIIVGIVTAAAYVATGTTAVYAGINTSTVDSDTTAFHYITYDTNSSAVNISNFTSGKNFNIVARNSSGGSRTIIIRSSTTASGHTALPQIVHSGGTITNGTITISNGAGLNIGVYNMNGTIIGTY